MKFLGTGMSRRTFSLGNGHCIKKPIEGRFEAGVMQNRQEYDNTMRAEEMGLYDLFPRIYKHKEDFSELEVEECKPVEREYLNDILRKHNYFKNDNIDFIAEFAFTVGCLYRKFVELGHDIRNSVDFANTIRSVLMDEKFCSGTMITPIGTTLTCWHAVYFLRNILLDKDSTYEVFRSIFSFYSKYPDEFIIDDLWNITQWGINSEGKLKIIDSGWSKNVSCSKEYMVDRHINKTYVLNTTDSNMFNGEIVDDINSPSGKQIQYMFKTEKDSEYILSSDNESRRIKHAGLKDDGLQPWMNKLMFMGYDDLVNAMNAINSEMGNMRPVKVSSNWKDNVILERIGKDGEWEKFYENNSISSVPIEGKNVLEFSFVGDNIIRMWHPGHAVKTFKKVM